MTRDHTADPGARAFVYVVIANATALVAGILWFIGA